MAFGVRWRMRNKFPPDNQPRGGGCVKRILQHTPEWLPVPAIQIQLCATTLHETAPEKAGGCPPAKHFFLISTLIIQAFNLVSNSATLHRQNGVMIFFFCFFSSFHITTDDYRVVILESCKSNPTLNDSQLGDGQRADSGGANRTTSILSRGSCNLKAIYPSGSRQRTHDASPALLPICQDTNSTEIGRAAGDSLQESAHSSMCVTEHDVLLSSR